MTINIADANKILSVAEDLYEKSPDWAIFWREIFGIDGAVHKKLRTEDEVAAFRATDQFDKIEKMLTALQVEDSVATEPKHTVGLRISNTLHQQLKQEAHDYWFASQNAIILAKFLLTTDLELLRTTEVHEKSTTARIPIPIHDQLKAEADQLNVAVHPLMVAKLRKPMEDSDAKPRPPAV